MTQPSMAVARPDEASAQTPGGEVIGELFAALESPLLSYAMRLLGDAGVAEDWVQEAFMNLQAQFEQVRQPRPWLYRTVHNLALNHLRDAEKIIRLNPPDKAGAPVGADTADPAPPPRARPMNRLPAGKASAWSGSVWKHSTSAAASWFDLNSTTTCPTRKSV